MSSFLYLVGSILFHSYFWNNEILAKIGVLLYIFGSILYFLAAFQQLLRNFQTLPSDEDVLPNNKMKVSNIDTAISFCVITITNISGILFIIGSIALWPTWDYCSKILGNWIFRIASSLILIKTVWILIRMQMKKPKCTIEKLTTIMTLFGIIGFLIGGVLALAGETHADHGSFSMMIGSYLFLVSSILSYKL